jgi:hypothetical protein
MYIFHVKIKLFVTLNSVQDSDPHGSALFGSLDPIRIWIRFVIKSWIRIGI